MFYQIFLSPQVKRRAIINSKHGIYEFPQEFPNDSRQPHGIFADGGIKVPTQEKKKKRLKILRN